MVSELCRLCKNWFVAETRMGTFEITDGSVSGLTAQPGQYIRIIGSVFNDGVYRYPTSTLKDETFEGAVWLMAVPQDFLDLAERIATWREKYENIDSQAMSPFNSESFGGYSYSKAAGSGAGASNTGNTWQSVFAPAISQWRKI